VLTVAVLLAAAALWTYTGQSDSSSSGPVGGQNNGWGDQKMPGPALPGPALESPDGHGAKGAENGDAHRHTSRSRPVISGPVPPRVRPVISGPVAPGGSMIIPLVPSRPVKTSPVSRDRRQPSPHPRTLPPRRVPTPRAPRRPSNPTPAPKPPPQQAPDTGTPTGGAPGTTPSDPGTAPTGTAPTDPGATPTNPGATPTDPAAPPVDPAAGLDDTPAGGLDQIDLGGPVDETPPAGATPGTP
jgi:hypothetical protein